MDRTLLMRSNLLPAGLLLALTFTIGCSDAMTDPPSTDEGATLNGQVRQVATEVLIENVEVTADGQASLTTPNGRYQFRGLEVGEVTIVATYPGFETYERRVRIREGSNTHNIAMIPIDPVQPLIAR